MCHIQRMPHVAKSSSVQPTCPRLSLPCVICIAKSRPYHAMCPNMRLRHHTRTTTCHDVTVPTWNAFPCVTSVQCHVSNFYRSKSTLKMPNLAATWHFLVLPHVLMMSSTTCPVDIMMMSSATCPVDVMMMSSATFPSDISNTNC
jgi:hypothetical protein